MSSAELCPMSSYMSPETRKAFCERPTPKAFVHNLRGKPRAGVLVGADMIRCRTNCLRFTGRRTPLPVYSVVDSVEPTYGQPVDLDHMRKPLAGFLYIHKPLDGITEPTPPWRGRDWHPICVAKELIDLKMITWPDITHKLIATGFLDNPAALTHMMEELCDGLELPAKKLVNSLIGTWMTSESYSYDCIQSTSRLDLAHHARGRKGYLSWHLSLIHI